MRTITFLFIALCLMGYSDAGAKEFQYNTDYPKVLARSRIPGDSLNYNDLLQRFLANDKNLSIREMLSLMIGYTGTLAYKPYAYHQTEKAIVQLNDQEKFEEAIQICDTFLTAHPLSQIAIIEKAYSFHKLKQTDSSRFYKEQFSRIMAAMDWSGDGHSPETAMFSIGQNDGQNFVDKYYHAELGRIGTIENKNGDLCAMVEMKFRKDGEDRKLVFYFLIQHATNTLLIK